MARPTGSKLRWVKTRPIFLSFLGLLAACAPSAQILAPPREVILPRETSFPSPYQGILRDKSLRTVPSFLLIDDFNTGDGKNRFGAAWTREEGLRQAEFKMDFPMQDARRGKRGKSLFMEAVLYPRKKGIVKSTLKGLDVSAAKGLVFKCRIKTRENKFFDGKLQLTLKDLKGAAQSVDFTTPCLPDPEADPDHWREVIIPRGLLTSIDWNLLDEITFSVSSTEATSLKARIWVDEIGFFGPEDIAFESQKDNLVNFPTTVNAPEKAKTLLLEPDDQKFLLEIARDTWQYFANALDKQTQLPVDHIRVGTPNDVGSYTTPTNLALYFLACISAAELGIIPRAEAQARVLQTLRILKEMKRWKGFHYNFYQTHSLIVSRAYVSVVDLGWLTASWMILRQVFAEDAEIKALSSQFLKDAKYQEFYDSNLGQLKLGFDDAIGKYSAFHYGLISTEARLASFIGIGKGDLPMGHWWMIYRAPPQDWEWQTQKPEGKTVNFSGYPVFLGFYQYKGVKFIPSWGGSMFEFLMPPLVMKEKELAPKSFGMNNKIATQVQINYALNQKKYSIWGISPASTSTGRLWKYGEYGVRELGAKGYRDEGIITPYAAFLALETLPEQAIQNIRQMMKAYPIYGEYGLYDSVNVKNSHINLQYLALDQGMILVAIANYLKNGVIKEYFHGDEIAQKAAPLLTQEEWFK